MGKKISAHRLKAIKSLCEIAFLFSVGIMRLLFIFSVTSLVFVVVFESPVQFFENIAKVVMISGIIDFVFGTIVQKVKLIIDRKLKLRWQNLK